MRKIIYILLVLVIFKIQLSYSQDTLVMMNNQKILVKVLEITSSEIAYKKMNYLDGPIYKTAKYELKVINFSNGSKEFFTENSTTQKVIENNSQLPDSISKTYYWRGIDDANKYYKNYKQSGTPTLLTTLFLTPIAGFIVAIVTSSTIPQKATFDNTNFLLFNNQDYIRGYQEQAWRIKRQKVWGNWAIGTTVWSAGLIFIYRNQL